MQNEQRTDERLVERARGGDRESQQVLWQDHRRWVAAIILAHRPNSIEVEDLMQEAAVKFLAKIDTLRDPSAFRPWMRRIAINICRGAGRRSRTTLRIGEGTEEAPGPTPVDTGDTALTSLGHSDAASHILQHALTLPAEYREPLLLRCLRSLSYQQIGEILDLPVTTVETRLARARRMLRNEIGEDAVAEECA